ncbi:MAG TPA: hypothetical protein PLD84_08140 [Chitinophagales bacterium]|nr:hypothetical protein [Chitinophagales bacterium]
MFKFLKFFIEVAGWIQIVASPFLIGLCIGALLYFFKPEISTLIISISVSTLGLIIGIVWATNIWIKNGTTWTSLTKISAPSVSEEMQDTNRKSKKEKDKSADNGHVPD